jgi:hypothetical protein
MSFKLTNLENLLIGVSCGHFGDSLKKKHWVKQLSKHAISWLLQKMINIAHDKKMSHFIIM